MMSASKPIVFFGTEDFSLITLAALIGAGLPIAAVVTKPDSPQGRGHKLTAPPVKILAEEHNIPVWQPVKLRDINPEIIALGEPVGILVSYGKIIPQATLDLFHPGIINLHPSLLPRYRGPSPVESAIINGDSETGVSIMQLSALMDAGPVYAQTTLKLRGDETAEHLYAVLGKLGTDLLLEALPHIIDSSLAPTPQDDVRASYCQLINKTDGTIDWSEDGGAIERKIRAYRIWPQSRATFGSVDVIITKAHVTSGTANPGDIVYDEVHSDMLSVGTGNGLLTIDAVKPIGKKEIPVQAFLAGYRSKL